MWCNIYTRLCIYMHKNVFNMLINKNVLHMPFIETKSCSVQKHSSSRLNYSDLQDVHHRPPQNSTTEPTSVK